MTKFTTTQMIQPGHTYFDAVSGEVVTVVSVGEKIELDNGLKVKDLSAFKPLDTTFKPELLKNATVVAKDGDLFIDGKEIETGTLYVEDVILFTGGRIVLAVRSLDEKDKELFVYNLSDDKFFKSKIRFEEFEELFEDSEQGLKLFKFNGEDRKVIPMEEVEGCTLPDGMSYEIEDECAVFSYPVEIFLLFRDGFLEASSLSDGLSELLLVKDERNPLQMDIIVLLKKKTEPKGFNIGDHYVDYPALGRESVTEIIFSVRFDSEGNFKGSDKDVFATSAREGDVIEKVYLVKDGRSSFIVVTDKGFVYSNNGYNPRNAEGKVALSAIASHPHFVSLVPGMYKNVFVLANDDREAVRLEVVKTSDRGFTTNLID